MFVQGVTNPKLRTVELSFRSVLLVAVAASWQGPQGQGGMRCTSPAMEDEM